MHLFTRRARGPLQAPPEHGASALEYALLIAAVVAVLVAVLFGIGSIVKDAFNHSSDCLTGGGTSTSCAVLPADQTATTP